MIPPLFICASRHRPSQVRDKNPILLRCNGRSHPSLSSLRRSRLRRSETIFRCSRRTSSHHPKLSETLSAAYSSLPRILNMCKIILHTRQVVKTLAAVFAYLQAYLQALYLQTRKKQKIFVFPLPFHITHAIICTAKLDRGAAANSICTDMRTAPCKERGRCRSCKRRSVLLRLGCSIICCRLSHLCGALSFPLQNLSGWPQGLS